MIFFKFHPFIFVTFSTMLIYTEGEASEDFSEAEKQLLNYSKYASVLTWMWSVDPFCKVMCPDSLDADKRELQCSWSLKSLLGNSCKGNKATVNEAKIEKRSIMLESAKCRKIEAELLTCVCASNQWNNVNMYWSLSFLSGLRGEIYRMSSPFSRTTCDDPETFTILRTIVLGGHEGERRTHLRGIDKVFEEISLEGFTVFEAGRRRVPHQNLWYIAE